MGPTEVMAGTATRSHPAPTRVAPRAALRLLTVHEAAAYLSVSVRFVRRIIFERRIPVVRLGRHVRLAEADLEAFVAAGRQPAITSPGTPAGWADR